MLKTAKRVLSIVLMFVMVTTTFGIITASEVNAASGLPKISSLKSSARETTVSLSWKALSKKQLKNVNGIAIYRNGELIKFASKKAKSFKDSKLKAGTNYKYTVKTYKKTKKIEWFNKKTQKWQKKKPAKKWRGKSRKIKKYSAGVSVNVTTVVRKYTITWKNWNETTTLATTRVRQGVIPTYNGPTPNKPADDNFTYEFIGWDPEPVAVNGPATYVANFRAVAKPEPTEFDYEIHIINEPYGHGGRLNVYVETNNPNRANYTISLQNASNQTEQPNILKTIYNGGNSSSYRDLDLSKIHGCIYICSPNYVGNGTLLVQEIDRTNGTRKIVASRSITLKDYYTEEHEWMQSVINQTTTSSMTNKQKMYAICDYIEHSFTYSLNDGWDGTGYIDLIVNAGIPYWKSKTANSSSSPAFLVEFGTLLGYQLHNCYADYPQGSTEWENYHMCAYSELDNTYYQCCPDLSTGTIDPNTITIFDPDTYQFWGE